MRYKNKKILVTGGAGFIASHVVDRLIQKRHKVVIVDNLSSGKKENLNPKAKFYKIDIRDPEISSIFRKEKPKVVFHYAAQIEARQSLEDPIWSAEVNILGSLNILENCRKLGVEKIIFASSGGEIYGSAAKIPTPESYLPSPLSPYGLSKLTIERYLALYKKLFGLSYITLRLGNVYGPRQNPYGEAGVIAIFANKMLIGEQVHVHGSGTQTKDYIFIEDVADATILSLEKGHEGVFNIGTGKETSVLELFNKIKILTNPSAKKKHVSLPLCSFPRGCLDITKAKKILNWFPKYSLDEGLRKTVEWFKRNSKKVG